MEGALPLANPLALFQFSGKMLCLSETSTRLPLTAIRAKILASSLLFLPTRDDEVDAEGALGSHDDLV
jgi:hypothetical protein